jgi:hypothetical protein
MHCHTVRFASSITMYVVTADYVKSAEIVRQKMTEPQQDDPVATGQSDECDQCGCFIYECVCNEPDRMYGDED